MDRLKEKMNKWKECMETKGLKVSVIAIPQNRLKTEKVGLSSVLAPERVWGRLKNLHKGHCMVAMARKAAFFAFAFLMACVFLRSHGAAPGAAVQSAFRNASTPLSSPHDDRRPLRAGKHGHRRGRWWRAMARDPSLSPRFPRAIIIGVRKGGTRALLEMLSMHPSVITAEKELHFFNTDEKFSKGPEWYRLQMPPSHDDQVTLEKTPAYFTEPEVPGRIASMYAGLNITDLRLLLILRDPIDRLLSDYTQLMHNRGERGKARPSLDEVLLTRDGKHINTDYKAIQRSLYAGHMENWLRHFSRDHLLIVDGDRLIREPLPELKRVEQFLGLPSFLGSDHLYFNATRGFYCLRDVRRNRCLNDSKGRPHPNVNATLLAQLQEFFRKPNHKLYTLVGQTFDWA
uniref:heparan sulfate glucosamine 3-O-sulfotransferase 1-like isoform X2 n=1 Tax=Myxine glutinosa TaxID=7769 RepID=UPI00358EFA2F